MPLRQLTLTCMPARYAICRLAPGAQIPPWAVAKDFLSVTRTAEELSITCEESAVPVDAGAAIPGSAVATCAISKGWRGLKIEGPFDFSAVGVLASVLAPLADGQISIFAVSTYDTDYLFIQEAAFDRAQQLLTASGHALRS